MYNPNLIAMPYSGKLRVSAGEVISLGPTPKNIIWCLFPHFLKVLESGITVSVAHFVSVILDPRSLRAQSHTDMVCSEPSSTATNKLPPSCNIKRILIKLDSE